MTDLKHFGPFVELSGLLKHSHPSPVQIIQRRLGQEFSGVQINKVFRLSQTDGNQGLQHRVNHVQHLLVTA